MPVLAPVLALHLFGCTFRAEDSPRPPLLVVTLDDPETLHALRPHGLWISEAFAQSPLVRPALASLWTGSTPDRHGLTDPNLHDLGSDTVAHALQDRGYTTFVDHTPLARDEDWGFATRGWGTGEGTLTWAHRPPRSGIERWLQAHPAGHALVTTLPRDSAEVEILWIGPDVDPGSSWTTQAAHIDIAATLLDLTGTPTNNALGRGGSDEIVVVESLAFHTSGGPLTRAELGRRPENVPHPGVVDRLVPAGESRRVTHPFGIPEPGEADTLSRAREALTAGRYRRADTFISRLETRSPGLVADILRARWLRRRGHPLASLEVLEARFAREPSDALALRIARQAWDNLQTERALEWVETVRRHRPHSAEALDLELRCLEELDRDTTETAVLHAVWGADPRREPEHLWEEGRWIEAMTLAESRLRTSRHTVRARLFLARAHLAIGEPERAVRFIEPITRRLEDPRIEALHERALRGVAERREYLQSLRGGWRGRP